MKRIIIAVVFLLSCFACTQKKSVPESLLGIKEVVARIDSTVMAIYGWEPQDSTYNHSVDTLVAAIVDQYEEARPEVSLGERTEHAIDQKAYDEARSTWKQFKSLCDADRYADALDFYLADDASSRKNNSGDFLVFLKHSTQRFTFFSQVLYPMMLEYKGEDYAINEYIDLLHLEKALEDMSIAMGNDSNGYVPEVYPQVVRELGLSLASIGKIDEAHELFYDLIDGVYGLTGNVLFANYVASEYVADLYLQDGMKSEAIANWNLFKNAIEENKDQYDETELELVLQRIDAKISELQ